MSTLLLNDTSAYHAGSAQAVLGLCLRLGIRETKPTSHRLIGVDWSAYSRVVVNGEGTMHHDAPVAQRLLRALAEAQRAGCRTELRNSVWQSMSPHLHQPLTRCDVLEVRDPQSAAAIDAQIGRRPRVAPDWCMPACAHWPPAHPRSDDIVEGQRFPGIGQTPPDPSRPSVNIFAMRWPALVARLRSARVLITGRHHEAYAAIQAGCPFIALPGNTWKNEGIFLAAGARRVWCVGQLDAVLRGDYDDDYQRVFAWAHGHDWSSDAPA